MVAQTFFPAVVMIGCMSLISVGRPASYKFLDYSLGPGWKVEESANAVADMRQKGYTQYFKFFRQKPVINREAPAWVDQ